MYRLKIVINLNGLAGKVKVALNDININPITTAYSVIEYVVKKQEKYPSVLPKAKQEKFDKMFKEDFFKDDPYRNMWDKDWINKK
jgi:hypothetical protein